MKALLLLLAFASAAPALADVRYPGTFVKTHDVMMPYYKTPKACRTGGGKWIDGYCIGDGEDAVTINEQNQTYHVEIQTVASSLNTCSFEGDVRAITGNKLIATDGACTLEIAYKTANKIDVILGENNEACILECGQDASLAIKSARRK